MSSTTWQERVEQEFEELDVRLVALVTFMQSPEFSELDIITQRLMHLQQTAMLSYGGSLQDRLDYDLTLQEDIKQAQAKVDALADSLEWPVTELGEAVDDTGLDFDDDLPF